MVAALALLGCTAANLSAQYGPIYYPTLEGLMGTSEKVFRGTVVKAQRADAEPHVQEGRFSESNLTTKFDAAWKGNTGKTVTLRRRTSDIDRRFEEYVQEKPPFIFFVNTPRRGQIVDWDTIRIGPTKAEGPSAP